MYPVTRRRWRAIVKRWSMRYEVTRLAMLDMFPHQYVTSNHGSVRAHVRLPANDFGSPRPLRRGRSR